MIADIAIGHHAGADVCFLLAVILAGLAAIVYAVGSRPLRRDTLEGGGVRTAPVAAWAPVLLSLAAGFLSLGLLIL